jgi:histidine triad (HIT) family protein
MITRPSSECIARACAPSISGWSNCYLALVNVSVGRYLSLRLRESGDMPTLFTKIIDGDLPGTFVWRDPECVAFLSISPVQPGHTLVVPREEVDHWIDLEPTLAAHLMVVAQTIARAHEQVYRPMKVGLLIAGLEVPHTHLHVIDIVHGEVDMHLDHNPGSPTPEELEAEAVKISAALTDLGAEGVSS